MNRPTAARSPTGTLNSWVYVREAPSDADEAEWSEAIVLEVVADGPDLPGSSDILLVDPDGERRLFDLSSALEFRLSNGDRLLEGLGLRNGAPVYRFNRPDIPRGQRWRELKAEALEEKNRLRAENPERYLAARDDGDDITGDERSEISDRSGRLPVVARERRPRDVAGFAPAPLSFPASREVAPTHLRDRPPSKLSTDDLEWYCVEPSCSLAFGSPLPPHLVPAIVGFGDRGVAPHPDGPVAVRGFPRDRAAVEMTMLAEDLARNFPSGAAEVAASPDARTLSVVRGSIGNRFRTWKAVAEALDQSDLGGTFGLDGPRTALYYCQEASKSGCGPSLRHTTWRHENKLQEEDRLNVTHEMLSEFLELLGCVDQLDLSNPAGVEAICRNLQHVEHEVKKRSDKAGAEMSDWFLGRARRSGGAIVSPELTEWVAKKAERRAAILKEERKLNVEQEELRKNKKDKKP